MRWSSEVRQGVWAAPGRVNLIGEHTDYNDGFVLPFALAQRTTVAARRRDGGWSVTSNEVGSTVQFGADDLLPGRITGWAAYVAGVVWVLADAGFAAPPAELVIDSDVPLGAGLSSSAALECSVLAALCDLGGIEIPESERPRLAQRAENVYVGVPCGIMDQTASTLGQDGHALLLDCRSLAVEQIPCEFSAAGLELVVIDTRGPHRHVDNEYAARRITCEQAARLLDVPALRDINDLEPALAALPDPVMRRRVRHVVTENGRVREAAALLRSGRIREVGQLLTASHASMRDDYEITVPEVDLAVDVALDHGAYGARMTGGGFGGSVLALVDRTDADSVAAAVASAFAGKRYNAPVSFRAHPSAGARRVA